jgi:hypothetical protein
MKKLILFCFLFLVAHSSFSQTDSLKKRKKNFYFMWGYNREAYTGSTIHFVNKGNSGGTNELGAYDFYVKDVRAKDKSDFDKLGDVINITIPQFNVRLGMWLNNKNDEGFEINYDHAKYVVTDGQTVRFKGTINGVAVDKDSILDRNYFHFEHTDGANFWQINYMKRNKIFYTKKENIKLSYVFKPGFGVVIPRTDVTLFGKHLNNNWKVAGVTASLETALHLEVYKHLVLEFAFKGGWANYMNAFVLGRGNGKASHQIGYVEGIFTFGYQF